MGLNGPERGTTAGIAIAGVCGYTAETFGGGGGIEEGGKSKSSCDAARGEVKGPRDAIGGGGTVVGGDPLNIAVRGIGGDAD